MNLISISDISYIGYQEIVKLSVTFDNIILQLFQDGFCMQLFWE